MRVATIVAFFWGMLFSSYACEHKDYSKQYTYWELTTKEREAEARGQANGYEEGLQAGLLEGKRMRDREWREALLNLQHQGEMPLIVWSFIPDNAKYFIQEITWQKR